MTRSRVSRLEWVVAGAALVVLCGLAAAEPDILEAPIENARTMVFTFGGTLVAAVVFALMLRARVHPAIRVVVLGAPFAAVTWLLLSPFFVDEVVDEEFATTIADAAAPSTATTAVATSGASTTTATTAAPAGPVLLGSGRFVGLAGHEGTGDAGFFALDAGRLTLRFENFDIENGPDLRLYVVAGADRVLPEEGSLYLGPLRGNVGDQTYDLPPDFTLTPGDWTVLVWCEAFDVEFVAATVPVAA